MARRFGRKSKKVEAEVESAPAVVDETTAVEQAAAVRLEGTVSGSVVLDDQGPGESDTGEALPGGMTWDQVNEAAEEQLAEAIAQTSSDGDLDDGGLGGTSAEDVAKAKQDRFDSFFGGGDDEDEALTAPFGSGVSREDVRAGGASESTDGAGGGSAQPVTEQGGTAPVAAKNVFGQDIDFGAQPDANPLAGAPAQDSLTSFVDALEAKTGRDSGLTTPGDAKDTSPVFGKDAISSGASGSTYYYTDNGSKVTNHNDGTKTIDGKNGSGYTEWPDGKKEFLSEDGTKTTIEPDGSTTTEKGGKVVDSTPPLKDPGPDGEGAPLPEELTRLLDADIAKMRAQKNAGGGGDGATDPSEIDSEVVGPAGELPDHAQVGRELFGQPDLEADTGGGAPSQNPGADSQGAGAITPGDDQNLPGGARRNDHPFDAAERAPEPPAESDDSDTEGDDDGGELFLAGSQIVGPVDDPTDEVPDEIFDPSAP